MAKLFTIFACSAFLLAPRAFAAIVLQLEAPDQVCISPCSLNFLGAIENTGDQTIYLNGSQIGATPGVVLDETPFYLYTPYFLDPGEQYGGLLFTALVGLISGNAVLAGEFAIFGGLSPFDYEELDRVSFSIEVQGSEVPETGTVALISIPLMGVLLLSRRR